MLKIRQYLPQNRPGDWRLYAAIAGGVMAWLLLDNVFQGATGTARLGGIAGAYVVVGFMFWFGPARDTLREYQAKDCWLSLVISWVVHIPTWPCYLLDEWGRDQD